MVAPESWRNALKRIDPLYDIIWNPNGEPPSWIIVCHKHENGDHQGYRRYARSECKGISRIVPLDYVILALVCKNGEARPLGDDILQLLRFWKNEDAVREDQARKIVRSEQDIDYAEGQEARHEWRQLQKYRCVQDMGAR